MRFTGSAQVAQQSGKDQQPPAGGTTPPVAGTVTTTSTTTPFDLVRAVVTLTDDAEEAQGH